MDSPRRTRSMTRSMQGIESEISLTSSTKNSAPPKKKRSNSEQSVEPVIRTLTRAKDLDGPGPSGINHEYEGPSRSVADPSGSMSVSSVRGSVFRANKVKNTAGETDDMSLEARANSLKSPPPLPETLTAADDTAFSIRHRRQPVTSTAKAAATRLQKRKDRTRVNSSGGPSGEPRDAGARGAFKVKKYLIGNMKNLCDSDESVDTEES